MANKNAFHDDNNVASLIAQSASSGDTDRLTTDGNGNLNVALSSDIEIGAVELKDGTTDTRATINAANTARTVATTTLVVQQVGADGTVPPSGSLVTNAPFTKVTDGTTTAGVIVATTALKTDTSSVAGTATSVSSGLTDAGTQRIALARDARGNSLDPELKSPQDFSVAWTSNVTLTCSGAPVTIDDANGTVQYIQQKLAAGTWGPLWINGQDGVSITAASNVITIAGAGTPFINTDLAYRVGFCTQKKAFTPATNSNRSEEINPLSQQYTEFSLVDTTNVAASQQYYPSSLGMAIDGYTHLTLTGKYIDANAVATLLSVQVTDDEDATNADWLDCMFQVEGLSGTVTGTVAGVAGTALVPGSTATTFTTSAAQTTLFALNLNNFKYKYFRVALLPGDATNTAIIKAKLTSL